MDRSPPGERGDVAATVVDVSADSAADQEAWTIDQDLDQVLLLIGAILGGGFALIYLLALLEPRGRTERPTGRSGSPAVVGEPLGP